MLKRILLLTLGLSLLTTASAEIYKYIDEHGQVQYTDKPALLPKEAPIKKQTPPSDNAALADRVAADLKARDAAAKAQAATKQAEAEKKKADELTAADKAERCVQARGKYENLTTSHRVYTLDAKGERVYLDDKQIEQSITAAKEQMDTWCN